MQNTKHSSQLIQLKHVRYTLFKQDEMHNIKNNILGVVILDSFTQLIIFI